MCGATVPLPTIRLHGVHNISFTITLKILADNIQMYLKVSEGVDWINLAQGRDQWWALVNIVINHPVP